MVSVKQFLAQMSSHVARRFGFDARSAVSNRGDADSLSRRQGHSRLTPHLVTGAGAEAAPASTIAFSAGSWRSRASQAASLFRVRPFDTTTPEGRSRERHRRVALTALARAMTRGLGILISLITVPLTIHYLGPERYGLWMTISSFIALLG